MKESDWEDVARIYHEGIDTGNSTFENEPPSSWEEWSEKKINECSLVARDDGSNYRVGGSRPVFQTRHLRGSGGKQPVCGCQRAWEGRWGSFAGRTDPGYRSVAEYGQFNPGYSLRTKPACGCILSHGFREVGILEKIGQMQFGENKGQWRDVVFVERRSKSVGI